jgi:hypothetical protein
MDIYEHGIDGTTNAGIAPPVAQYANSWIGIKHFDGKGRGVIALCDIPADTVIERCPVLIIPNHDRGKTDTTVVFTYV